ncbi:MAG: hypothetical protein US96_C0028G0013 [Candidatus Woesebacteria bacterium GW2011_GWB1_38_5b]|uniref:DUF5666 domain-containing protein n=1 Tax=Candidatus Woesebacteria bacterium GW2011_GWB1_38_5b TaxID=1618569 RepID=A0A0G0MLX5_9BACT|nr:MAG: hypothetical protein US96_C0028G0013 [Candidatus Woesebacteria bacterium GW2011_GWB1_38_5b]OGH47535.1 MAG: hypothetical protein A3A51_03045 [Candidatus Levybacteria bacterium RIFCSPLOWO2_01_FULL_39_10]
MRKIILIITLFLFLPGGVSAQNGTGSTIPSSKTLDAIKDKVASRVAELNLVEKRGIIGTVDEISDTQIIVTTLSGKRRIVDVDEFTVFSGNLEGISDIEKEDVISILGLYNKDSERLLARYINSFSIPLYLTGVISEVDSDNFTITLTTKDKENYIVDVERITETFEFDRNSLENSGFSNFETFKNAFIIGFEDEDEEGRITASKIIVFPNSPKDPNIEIDLQKSPSPIPKDKK